MQYGFGPFDGPEILFLDLSPSKPLRYVVIQVSKVPIYATSLAHAQLYIYPLPRHYSTAIHPIRNVQMM